MNNITRDDLQTEALQLMKTSGRVILNWGTGVGKSRPAVLSSCMVLDENPSSSILLVVQETAHKTNWQAEFQKALGIEKAESVLGHIQIDCYASLSKHANTYWDLIIFDEGHHLRSPLRLSILRTMSAKRVLLLSATISDGGDGDEMLECLNSTFGPFITKEFRIQKAIDNGFLGIPEINVIPVVLQPKQVEEYNNLDRYQEEKKKEYFSARMNAGLAFGDKRETSYTEELKGKWLNAGTRKKRYLGYKKTTVAKNLLKKVLFGTKYVCFCASVKQVEWLGGKNYVCSKRTAKENREAIAAFNEDRESTLYTVGMLQEGQNLAGIQTGLIVQLDGKERSFVQKFGRVMRAKVPILYILFVIGTRDEDYLKTALSGINKEYIKYWDPVYTDGTQAPAMLKQTVSETLPLPKSLQLIGNLPPGTRGKLGDITTDNEVNFIYGAYIDKGLFVLPSGQATPALKGYFRYIARVQGGYAIVLKDVKTGTGFAFCVNTVHFWRFLLPMYSIEKLMYPLTFRIQQDGYVTMLHGNYPVYPDRKLIENVGPELQVSVPYLDEASRMINLALGINC